MDLRWVGLFRDGTSFAYDGSLDKSLDKLNKYILGTVEQPKRHFMLWFKVRVGNDEFTINFDDDGDAYLHMPDGKILMTEHKIRSANLIFYADENILQLGFAGIDTTDQPNGKSIIIDNLVSNNTIATDIIKV